jgi:hypothetical protein
MSNLEAETSVGQSHWACASGTCVCAAASGPGASLSKFGRWLSTLPLKLFHMPKQSFCAVSEVRNFRRQIYDLSHYLTVGRSAHCVTITYTCTVVARVVICISNTVSVVACTIHDDVRVVERSN